jgi:recombination protein RecA
VKNKVAPPFREAEFDILFGKGVSREGDVLDMAANNGIVEKTGSWYAYGKEKIGQGREQARKFLIDNPQTAAEIEALLRKKFAPGASAPVEAAPEPEAEEKTSKKK